MLDNKWKQGKVHFEFSKLPQIILASSGIKPISAILDINVGEEIILLITEPREKVKEFEGMDITRLMLKLGLVNTSFGPVCFILFYFPSPFNGGEVAYENTVNPKDDQQLLIYKQLSQQKYWHVVIADDMGRVVNFFEFPNQYDLADTINHLESACKNMEVTNFMAAKAEYESGYSIDQLLAM